MLSSYGRPERVFTYVYDDDIPRPMRVRHQWRRERQRDVFTVEGEVDLATADVLFDRLLPAIFSGDSNGIWVNMAAVTFFDSTGLDVLMDMGEMAAALGKSLVLVEPSKRVVRVIQLLGRGDDLAQVVCAGRQTTYFRCEGYSAPFVGSVLGYSRCNRGADTSTPPR